MMKVWVNSSALMETQPHELAVRFLLGGTITVVTGLIATQWGPVIGGLFLAFPAIFPASVTLIETHAIRKKQERALHGKQRGRDAAGADAAGAAIGSIGLLIFGLVVHIGVSVLNPWIALGLATFSWLSVSTSIWWLWKNYRVPYKATHNLIKSSQHQAPRKKL